MNVNIHVSFTTKHANFYNRIFYKINVNKYKTKNNINIL